MPRMPIRMIALIMVVHNCPLGRLLGRGGGMGLGRSSVTGMGGQMAVYMTEFKGAW